MDEAVNFENNVVGAVDEINSNPSQSCTSQEQSQATPMETDDKKRPALTSFSPAVLRQARSMMARPECNAISVLHFLKPNFEFREFDKTGLDHMPIYKTRIEICGKVFEGEGSNKKKAKNSAAENVMKSLLSDVDDVCGRQNSVTDGKSPVTGQNDTMPSGERPDDGAAMTTAIYDESGVSANPDPNAAAELQPSDVGSTPKVAEPIGVSPVAILNDIRPGVQYFLIVGSEEEESKKPVGPESFKMGVVINGERFEGVGTSKKLAKCRAAEAGLQKLFGLEFSYNSGGIPVFTGDQSCWSVLKKVKHKSSKKRPPVTFHLLGGKHPLQLINELYPDAVLTFNEDPAAESSKRYSVCMKVEDNTFECKGSSKRIARLNAAVEAVNFLKRSGQLDVRLAEKQRDRKMVKPRWHRPAFLKSNGKPFFPSSKSSEPVLKDAVIKLKEKFGRVDYEVVSETSPMESNVGELPKSYTVMAMVLGQTFMGEGPTKSKARLEAAETAMKNLGLWTDEEEKVKQESERQEAERTRLERMLYRKDSRTKNYSYAYDWRKKGKSWVAGGILDAMPLILPNSEDGGYFNEYQDGNRYGYNYGQQFEMVPQNEPGTRLSNDFSCEPRSGDFDMGSCNDFPPRQLNYGLSTDSTMERAYYCGTNSVNNTGIQQSASVDHGCTYNNYGTGENFTGNCFGAPDNGWRNYN